METILEVIKCKRLPQDILKELLATIWKLDAGSQKIQSLLKHSIIGARENSGLEILTSVLPLLPDDVISEKMPLCTSLCLNSTNKSQENDQTASLRYNTFHQLLERCLGSQELERTLNNQMLAEFFTTLSSCPASASVVALDCLQFLLKSFGKHCAGQRTAVEKFLVQFLDCDDSAVVIKAGTCAALVQQIRPSGDHTLDAKSSWSKYFLSLCHASQLLIEEMFSAFVESLKHRNFFQSADTESTSGLNRSSGPLHEFLESIALTDSPMTDGTTPVDDKSVINRRLKNVLVYLQASLVGWYPVGKLVNLQAILDPLFLLIGFTKTAAKTTSTLDDIMVEAFLPGLKTYALRTLDAVLHCLQINILPYSKLFLRMLVQAIQFSKGQDKNVAYRKLRIQAYFTLKQWLNVVKCHNFSDPNASSSSDKTEDELITTILQDVTFQENSILLTVTEKAGLKNLSKKAKRRLTNSQMKSSSLARHAPGMDRLSSRSVSSGLDSKLRIAALNCLETIFITSGCFLKDMSHKKVQNALVVTSSAVGLSAPERLALYKCLEATRLGYKPGVPVPTQYLMKIFSAEVGSRDLNIASFCSQALRCIRVSIHRSPPTLSFLLKPADHEDQLENGFDDHGRNQQSLCDLLGSDRYQQIAVEITDRKRSESAENVRKPKRVPDDSVHSRPKKCKLQAESSNLHEAITQIDLANDTFDDTIISLESSEDSDKEDDIIELKNDEAMVVDNFDKNSNLGNSTKLSKFKLVLRGSDDGGSKSLNSVNLDSDNEDDIKIKDSEPKDGNESTEFSEISSENVSDLKIEKKKLVNDEVIPVFDRSISPQVVISSTELDRIPLSFPVTKLPPSQESTHSDDLVITCGQNRDDVTASSLDVPKPAVKPDDVETGSADVEDELSVKEMLKTFVDETIPS